jgi:type II secretory ATPase GspE/PulE/Tfp pilus assembly ATPase PilB-like protein
MIEAIAGAVVRAGLPAVLAQATPTEVTTGGVPPSGGYLSIIKIAVMLAMVVPYLAAAPWIHRDSQLIRAPRRLWGSLILGVGAASFLIWLFLPYYFAGLFLYLLATAAMLFSYLAYRNSHVSEDRKVSLRSLFRREPEKVEERPVSRLQLYTANGGAVHVPSQEADGPEAVRAYNLAQEVLYDMVWRRASEIDLTPAGQQVKVRFVIDGVAVGRPSRSLAESETIIQYLKPIAGMVEEDRRRPQRGRISVDMVGKPIDIMLVTAGSTTGQRLQCRVVQEFVQTNLDQLGISSDVLERVEKLTQMPRGLFIVSGRPGSGLTSTLYSILREQDAFTKQLATLEAEVSVDLENITHHGYGDPANLPGELASVLRRDPDVVMVDQCPDSQTASLICQAAQRKLVLLGMQAGDSFTALAKWVKVCSDPGAAMANLHGVLCQMLLRKLCAQCREPYRPDPQLLAKANIPAEKIDVFYRPPTKPLTDEKGQVYTCHACQGTGYFGRTAAFELLEITEELKKLVVAGAPLLQIKATARKNRMLYLQEQALRKVISRETSIQEVIRGTQQKK